MIIEIIGKNTIAQNQLVAQLYEKEHGARSRMTSRTSAGRGCTMRSRRG